MASTIRELPLSDKPQQKKAKFAYSEPSQSVVLNPADCDIDFDVQGKGLQGSALYEESFAYCWSGARANMGITRGKYCFGCKIISAQPVDMEDTPLDQQHFCGVGISRGGDPLRNLGQTVYSFGFGGTGKFANSKKFHDYGETFGVGDTIVCAVDLENGPMASIGFSRNGKWLGVAMNFDAGRNGLAVVDSPIKKLQWESALFPHVLLKNVVVRMQFSVDDGLIPEEGYRPWAAAILDGNTLPGPVFPNQHDCEVIMMVGLPASGKTTWAEKWVIEHPEKRYVLLGTNLALEQMKEQMKVPGLSRKNTDGERFNRLMERAAKIYNVLLSRASRIPRNFIIDQMNVYKSTRKHKLKPFTNYIKIAVVVYPREGELNIRAKKRFEELGEEAPDEGINEMLAHFTLPKSKDMPGADEYFDQVLFVELSRAESQRFLDQMKIVIRVMPFLTPYTSKSSYWNSLLDYYERSLSQQSVHNQGVGDHSRSSNSSQPLSRAPPRSSPSTNDPRRNLDHTATQSSHGSRWTQVSGPSNQSSSNNAQVYPQPSTLRPPSVNLPMDILPPGLRPPSVNFPMDVQPPGLYPPPRPGW